MSQEYVSKKVRVAIQAASPGAGRHTAAAIEPSEDVMDLTGTEEIMTDSPDIIELTDTEYSDSEDFMVSDVKVIAPVGLSVQWSPPLLWYT